MHIALHLVNKRNLNMDRETHATNALWPLLLPYMLAYGKSSRHHLAPRQVMSVTFLLACVKCPNISSNPDTFSD